MVIITDGTTPLDVPSASPVPAPIPTPRTTGSMVTHNDDEVTRMKNIEMIEIGMYRIKPWYFSPYPQVSWLSRPNFSDNRAVF